MNKKILASIIVILIVAAGVYFYSKKSQDLSASPSPAPIVSATPAVSASPEKVTAEHSEPTPDVKNDDSSQYKLNDDRLLAYEKKLAKALREESAGRKDIVWKKFLKGTGKYGEKNQQLFREYLDLLKIQVSDYSVAPGLKVLDLFFDFDTFGLTDEERALLPKDDEMHERAFGYIADLDPIWCLEYASDLCNNGMFYTGGRENLPERYRAYWDDIEKGRYEYASAVVALSHIFFHSYDFERASSITQEVLDAVRDSGVDAKGKVFADVGAGSGMALPFFRKAAGDGVKLFAVEINPYTLDLLRYTAKFSDATVVEGSFPDCCLPEESVDIMVLIGVHMGAGFHERYETCTLPWMKSMRKALRPNGIIVIHDGNLGLLDDGLVERMESAGFKLRKMFPPNLGDNVPEAEKRYVFIAVFDK
ncbi:MAG: methyltransferase domain-containing protein [bacterium]|nr:methyltransferase domain-containing protein [bacterium]